MKIVPVFLAIFSLFIISGLAGRQLTVGYILFSNGSTRQAAETLSIQNTAAERNIDLKISDTKSNPGSEIKALRSFIYKGVDCILITPLTNAGWNTALREAKRRRIPVIFIDRLINLPSASYYSTWIAPDYVSEGKEAAWILSKKSNGKLNIIELISQPGTLASSERKRGFEEGLRNYPGMKVIKTLTGNDGRQIMETYLKTDTKNFNTVYADCDSLILSAIGAMEDAGLKPGKDILTVSIEGSETAFEAMTNNRLNASVECNTQIGPLVFDTLNKLLEGEEMIEKKISPQASVYPQETAAYWVNIRKN